MQDRQRIRKQALVRALMAVVASVLVALGLLLLDGLFWPAAISAVVGGITVADWFLRQRGAVPVLVYHSVSDNAGWLPWARNTSVRIEVFRRHLRVLEKGGWNVMHSREIAHARRMGVPLPPRTVALQFDDGYLDNWVAAVPLLEKAGFPAVIFASTDFIDPSSGVRPNLWESGAVWEGYMNRDELRAVDANPLFEIASHGANHGRVPVNGPAVGTWQVEDWQAHAALLWAGTYHNKSHWFRETLSPALVGQDIPASDSALTGRALVKGSEETSARYHARVLAHLKRARNGLEHVLKRPVDFLCWPYDRVTPAARALAEEAGFALFTGGRGENRVDEDPTTQSRVHINDFSAGPAPIWVEALVFRARLGVAAGNYWWMPVAVLATRRRARHLPVPKGPGA